MKGRIEIDRQRCKGCGYCVITCPKKVISIDGEFNSQGYYPAFVTNPDDCTGCALCAQICPDIAIVVFREEKTRR